MEIFAVASPVYVGPERMTEALVLGVTLEQGGHVTYRVAWWDETDLVREWLEACEVAPHGDSRYVTVTTGGDG